MSVILLWPNTELQVVRHAHEKAASLFHEFMQGWRAVWQDPLLRLLSLTGAIFHILYHGHIALQVLIATQELGLSPALFASLATTRGVQVFGEKRLLLASLVMLAAAWIALAVLPRNAYTVLLYAPVIFAFDMAVTAFSILFVSIRQIASPPALMGRVTATSRFLAFAVAPLGGIAFGWLAEHAGLRWTYVSMGALGIVFTCMLAWRLRNGLVRANHVANGTEPVAPV